MYPAVFQNLSRVERVYSNCKFTVAWRVAMYDSTKIEKPSMETVA